MATSVIRALQLAALLVLANIAQAAVDPPPAYKQIALPKGVPAEVLYSVAQGIDSRQDRLRWGSRKPSARRQCISRAVSRTAACSGRGDSLMS